jgi:hypothetical protein
MSDLGSQPFSIRLFLAEGSALGLTIATIGDWAGSLMRCGSGYLPVLLGRPEAQRSGVYVILMPDPKSPNQSPGYLAYIGQGGKVGPRLNQSLQKYPSWETVVVLTTSDTNFAAGHWLALEAMMIAEAKAACRVRLDNLTIPAESAGALGEADRADITRFLKQARQILPALAIDLLRPQPHLSPISPLPGPPQTTEFYIRYKGVTIARAQESDNEFVVEKDSQALKKDDFAKNSYAHLRANLVLDGSLGDVAGSPYLIFTRDVAFKSTSAAAAVVLNRNCAGPVVWKVNGSNDTYLQWQAGKSPHAQE